MKISRTTVVASCILGLCAVILIAAVPSCKKSSNTTGVQSFYDSLGGTTLVTDPANLGQTVEKGYLTIRTFVDSALLFIATDSIDSLSTYFPLLVEQDTLDLERTEYQKLSLNITNFVAVAAGAKDYSYTGPDMSAAHNPDSNSNIPMRVDSAAFNEFAFDIGQAARNYGGLSDQLISQLGTLLYRYEGQIVQR